ncbi:NlpC/P60 family protein [Alicyclobacillus fastidiosus]|uniref:NlpC/P60 family protein n=1 Tax=Alicyclobacillus fastidiosus TaxID=392011 RepID=A0ABY6ZII7_9BACL|nr:NlpC/P60 family protein [Alicyclobacillus fastidiosus]WAH41720.1 NlpC/P60 family protein [Alicyclobacillus fastidiosus]GMA63403.1 NLP/P60 protein [Alicyclobacillus fastidiosus]
MKRSLIAVTATLISLSTAGLGTAFAATNKTYTMQPGDTMYKISVAQHVSLSALESANPQITNYKNIRVGQVINIPTSTTVTAHLATAGKTASTVTGSITSGASSTSTERQNILTYAKSLIGTPYAWGGDTPSSGFDCSGFVEYVYGHFGVTLPRESHDQATVGQPVSQSALQPGDLLFFKDTDSSAALYSNHVTHVGIYMGNGAMIESSSSNNNEGVVVVQNVFSNPYYTAHYYGARNVLG